MASEKKTSSVWYLIGGAAVGAAVGVLFAPKKGSELREDLSDWGKRGGEKGKELADKAKDYLRKTTTSSERVLASARDKGLSALQKVGASVE